MAEESRIVTVWLTFLRGLLKIPGAKIDREKFLRNELSDKLPEVSVEKALLTRPAQADITKDFIKNLSKKCIRMTTLHSTAASAGAAIPSGLWLIGSVPADLTQFYWNMVRLAQKLAYLHGWPDLKVENSEFNDDSLYHLSIFMGVMAGVDGASRALAYVSKSIAEKEDSEMSLLNCPVGGLIKEIIKWLGIKMSKARYSKMISKAIPVAGIVLSGGITYFALSDMGETLRKNLAGSYLANT